MSKVPDGVDPSELNVAARRVLLDALGALNVHREALVVVGAQAVYLQTQKTQLTVATFTSDGDLSVDPELLASDPLLEAAMREAGFELRIREKDGKTDPGVWAHPVVIAGEPQEVSVDLLVPTTSAPAVKNSSAARIPPHELRSAKKVSGLEATLVDWDRMQISALDPADDRMVRARVAGPASLMIAKAHKLNDRLAKVDTRPDRLVDKDAGDVLRLMLSFPAKEVSARMATLLQNGYAEPVTRAGLQMLESQFGGETAPGVEMAVRSLAGAVEEAQIRLVAPAYVGAVVAATGA